MYVLPFEEPQAFLKQLHHFSSSPATYEGPNFSTFLATLVTLCLFQESYLVGVKWYLLVDLICISLCRVSCVEHLLMLNIISNSGNAICIGHLSIFFEMSIQILCSLNFFISECKSALLIEDVRHRICKCVCTFCLFTTSHCSSGKPFLE